MKYNNGLPYLIGTLSFYGSFVANFAFLRALRIWNWTVSNICMPESGELIKNFLGEKYRCLCSRTPTLERNSVVKLDNRARDRELCILVVSTHYTVIPLHTNCLQNNHFRIVLDHLESKAIGQHGIVSLIPNKNNTKRRISSVSLNISMSSG